MPVSDICVPSTISTANSTFILHSFLRTAPFRVTPSGLRRRTDSSPLALFSICICYVCFWPCWPHSGHSAGASLPLSALIWYDISELGLSKPGGGRGPRCIAEAPVWGLGYCVKITVISWPCDHFYQNHPLISSYFEQWGPKVFYLGFLHLFFVRNYVFIYNILSFYQHNSLVK